MELLEVESSVVVFTALALLLAAAVLLRRRREEAAASVGSPAAACAHDEPSSRRLAAPRQAVPQPEAVSVDPEPGQESKSCTGTASAPEDNLVAPICGSEPVSESPSVPEAVSVPEPLLEPSMRPIISELFPNTVNELCFVKDTLSLALTSGPETAPQPEAIAKKNPVPVQENNHQLEPVLEPLSTPEPVPETIPQVEPVHETLVAPEPVSKTVPQLEPVHETLVAPEPFPETIPVPEPVHETLVAPEAVPETLIQLESAIEKCYALEQVSKPVEPVLEQLSETEPTSEQELEAVVLVSEPLSVAQVIPEESSSSKPVSDLQPVVQSESEPKEFLQVVAERLFGPVDESVFAPLPRSDQEKPPTREPVAEQAADDAVPQADLQPEPEPNGAAVEDDKVTFTPGKKALKFETLMTKEELEEEQRVQQEQLAAIFLLLRENAEALGEVTEGDMEEQLKLYSL
ncbi:FILIA-N KH-like domain-containing protein [Phycodurus eques]|uniref:FILIA-N KH-like domain-containing protein n=1 Tax=Phycodurus eques TaxID=693459 RepID=UPI002ACEA728|nr:FILIA-N KH-like domain-containing protein [Phycodurus eques]